MTMLPSAFLPPKRWLMLYPFSSVHPHEIIIVPLQGHFSKVREETLIRKFLCRFLLLVFVGDRRDNEDGLKELTAPLFSNESYSASVLVALMIGFQVHVSPSVVFPAGYPGSFHACLPCQDPIGQGALRCSVLELRSGVRRRALQALSSHQVKFMWGQPSLHRGYSETPF